MSRSYRHTPIWGMAAPRDSAKWEKRHWNRIDRATVRGHLAHERWDEARWDHRRRGEIAWTGIKEYRVYHSPYDLWECERCQGRTLRERERLCYCFWSGLEHYRRMMRK